MQTLLIELQYFGSISWYLTLMRHKNILIEAHENFEKSTCRNRCYIASPDGKLRLTIPLLHGRNQRARYADVRIDYSAGWQKKHWDSLCSCYRNSPYFEYYEDRFFPLFHNRTELLFEFNRKLFYLILELSGIHLNIQFTAAYEKNPADVLDLRSKIIPVDKIEYFPLTYRQVFQERTGFLPDLSMADLLFNEGPHAGEILATALQG